MLPEENILVLSQLISSLKEEIMVLEGTSDMKNAAMIKVRMEKLNEEIKRSISTIKLEMKSI